MNRLHHALLAPLFAVLALLLALTGNASAAFNPAAQNPHYGEFLLQQSEVSASEWLQPADPAKENGEWIYDGALGVPVYVRQNPWTAFDPHGLATTILNDGAGSVSTEMPDYPILDSPSSNDSPSFSAKDLVELADADVAAQSNPLPREDDFSTDRSSDFFSMAQNDAAADSGKYGPEKTRLFRQRSQSMSDANSDFDIFSGTMQGVAAITQPETAVVKGLAVLGLAIKGVTYADDLMRAANAGVQVEQYALRAADSGFYPVMTRGSKAATEITWLEKGDVWKFGTTKNPATRYSQSYLDNIGDHGVLYRTEWQGTATEALQLERMKIMNFQRQTGGVLPAGNKIVR